MSATFQAWNMLPPVMAEMISVTDEDAADERAQRRALLEAQHEEDQRQEASRDVGERRPEHVGREHRQPERHGAEEHAREEPQPRKRP